MVFSTFMYVKSPTIKQVRHNSKQSDIYWLYHAGRCEAWLSSYLCVFGVDQTVYWYGQTSLLVVLKSYTDVNVVETLQCKPFMLPWQSLLSLMAYNFLSPKKTIQEARWSSIYSSDLHETQGCLIPSLNVYFLS